MTIVYGVDLATLEGWMLKVKSHTPIIGKSTSRRWFRVTSEYSPVLKAHDLRIAYFSTKISSDPKGYVFLNDVSGIYCRPDMIEIVSKQRTLRLKGETTKEHRLWTTALHQLYDGKKQATSQPTIPTIGSATYSTSRISVPSNNSSMRSLSSAGSARSTKGTASTGSTESAPASTDVNFNERRSCNQQFHTTQGFSSQVKKETQSKFHGAKSERRTEVEALDNASFESSSEEDVSDVCEGDSKSDIEYCPSVDTYHASQRKSLVANIKSLTAADVVSEQVRFQKPIDRQEVASKVNDLKEYKQAEVGDHSYIPHPKGNNFANDDWDDEVSNEVDQYHASAIVSTKAKETPTNYANGIKADPNWVTDSWDD